MDDTLPLTSTDAAGQVTGYTYTALGQVKTVTRTRTGHSPEKTTYKYYGATGDGNAHRLETIRVSGDLLQDPGGDPDGVLLSTFTYDAAGRVATSTTGAGADAYTVTNYYDAPFAFV